MNMFIKALKEYLSPLKFRVYLPETIYNHLPLIYYLIGLFGLAMAIAVDSFFVMFIGLFMVLSGTIVKALRDGRFS